MSATSEALLLQILDLESKIAHARLNGEDSSQLELALEGIKVKFSSLNEALEKSKEILKG